MRRNAPRLRRSRFPVLVALLALLPAGCLSDWHKSPLPSLDDVIAAVPWFAVMHKGIAIQPYKMPRMPVEGTVPVGGGDFVLAATQANRAQLDALRNPMPRTAQSLARGRERYDIYCGVCHGVDGRGDGPVAQPLGGIVRDLTEPRMRQISDGWMYAVIANGFGLMPEHKSKLAPVDRWNIVNYVRTLQGAAQ